MVEPSAYPSREAAIEAEPVLDIFEKCDTFKHKACAQENAPQEIRYGARKGQWQARRLCGCPCHRPRA